MDILEILAQLDLSKLDKEWQMASTEEAKSVQKRSDGNVKWFLWVGIVGIVASLLIFLISLFLLIRCREADGVWTLFFSILLLVFSITFYPIRCGGLIRKYKSDVTVLKKRIFLIQIISVRNGRILYCGEMEKNNEIKIRTIPDNFFTMQIGNRMNIGECLTLFMTDNGMIDVKVYSKYDNVLKGGVNNTLPFQKMAERPIYILNDHRKVVFYMKKTDTHVRFLAVKERLDISDDAVIQPLNRYQIEEYPITDKWNPKLLGEFMERVMTDLEKEMKNEVTSNGNS